MDKNCKGVGDIIGGFGKWQLNLFLFDFVIQMLSTMNALSMSFMAPNTKFWCTSDSFNTTGDQCKYSVGNETRVCDRWDYDRSLMHTSVITEWNIVCNKDLLASFSSSIYMTGYFISSLLSGDLSDRFGRLPVLRVAVAVELSAGLSMVFSSSFLQFIISRFILAMAAYAKFLTGFTLLVECVSTEHRTTYGVLARAGRSFGHMLLPVVAYFIRDFRFIQLAITINEILLAIWLLKINESPRWLLVNSKLEKVENLVERALKINGKEVEDLKGKLEAIKNNINIDKNSKKKPNFFDLWKTHYLLKNTTIMSFNWFVTVFIYYGISFNLQALGGNHYFTFFIAGLVEIPATILCVFVLKRCDRTTFLSVSLIGMFLPFLCGAILSLFDLKHKMIIRVVLAMVGKFFSTCAFSINYILTGEMYPTVVRQIGIGTNSAAGRIGSMLSPFIKELNSKFHETATFSLFGIVALFDAIIVQFLPETRGKDIPDTIAQVEGKKSDFELKYIQNDICKISSDKVA